MRATAKIGCAAICMSAILFPFVSQAKTVTITMFEQWGASDRITKAFEDVAKEFQKSNPNVKVKIVNSAGMDKLITTMAAGVGPDVAIVDERISSYALKKLMLPLDSYIRSSKISPDDFWAPSWRECIWEDKVWAIPWGSDPNFGLYWNKGMFREVGANPDSPPDTMDEMNQILPKFTKKDPNTNNIKRFGLIPWDTGYMYSNAIYTWGWCFGGEFYDIRNKKVTTTDPKLINALEWMRDLALKNGGLAKVNAASNGLKTGQNFFSGERVAMAGYGPWELPQIRKYGTSIDFGIGRMPVVQGAGDPTWVGGHKIIMPLSVKNKKEAWDFIKFIGASPKGSAFLAQPLDWFPGYKGSEVYSKYRSDQYLASYVRILEKASHQRPVMPAAQKYWDELDKAVSSTLQGKKEPAIALAEVQRETQKELDRILSKYAGRK